MSVRRKEQEMQFPLYPIVFTFDLFLTPNSRSVYRAEVSLNIHSFPLFSPSLQALHTTMDNKYTILCNYHLIVYII